jgi:hypothetical protein
MLNSRYSETTAKFDAVINLRGNCGNMQAIAYVCSVDESTRFQPLA